MRRNVAPNLYWGVVF